MTRLPRTIYPGVPVHAVQRGINRSNCFYDDVDRRHFLSALGRSSQLSGCQIHAWVLMSNHYHLVLTPAQSTSISRLVQRLGARYVNRFNERHNRSGPVWERRFWSANLGDDEQFLACCRYVELNPVRAGLVDDPLNYIWSSAAANALGRVDGLVTLHPLMLGLGHQATQRHAAWRSILQTSDSLLDDPPGLPDPP